MNSRSASASSAPPSRCSRRRAITAPRSPTSSAVRPVGRGDLHALQGQGRAVPPGCDLISGQGLDELAIRLAPLTSTADQLTAAVGLLRRDDRRVRGRARAGRPRARLGGGRRGARRPRDARAAARAAGRGRADAAARGRRARRAPGLARRRRLRPRLPRPARRPAAPAHRGGGRPTGPRSPCAAPAPSSTSSSPPRRRRASRPPRRRSIAGRWPTSRPSSGRSIPPTSGSRCPHEHTQIALWHVPDRWDYWQLTRDEPLILEELAAYPGGRRQRAGRPDAARRRARPGLAGGLARATGLHIVMGCGWYRDAYYPAEARIDRRSVDDLADELVARGDRRGRRHAASGPGSSARSAPTSRGCRRGRSASIAPRPGPPGGPAWRSRPTPSCRRSGSTSSRIFEAEGADPTRVVIGHADSYPHLDHHLAIVERGASVEFDFLGMSFTPAERHGEGRIVELLCELLARGHVERILLSQDVCHDSQLSRYERQRLHVPRRRSFLPRLREAGRQRRRDRDDDGRQPAAAADDRVADARVDRRSALQRGVDAQLDVALERLADRAAVLGRLGRRRRSPRPTCPGRRRGPSARSRRRASRRPACRRSRRRTRPAAPAACPARPSAPEKAIAKQEACAAATSSSGLVLPSGDSVRAAQLTGRDREGAARHGADRAAAGGEIAGPRDLGATDGGHGDSSSANGSDARHRPTSSAGTTVGPGPAGGCDGGERGGRGRSVSQRCGPDHDHPPRTSGTCGPYRRRRRGSDSRGMRSPARRLSPLALAFLLVVGLAPATCRRRRPRHRRRRSRPPSSPS